VSGRGRYANEDFFDPDELTRLRDYVRPLRRVRRIERLLSTAISLVLIFGLDIGPKVTGWVGGQGWFIRLIVVISVMAAIETAVKAPFSAWTNLAYEKRAGHSTMTTGLFVKDMFLQELLLEVVVGTALLTPVYAAIHASDQWWLIGGLVIVAVLIVLTFVAPVLIMPRFNKFTPLEDGPIRQRIEEIARMSGVDIQGVYLMDASKRTTRANAGVTGFGKTKRVIVNDTICEFPIEELSQVIAHELGHYRLNHVPKSFPMSALQMPLALLIVRLIAGNDTVLGWAGVRDLGDPATYPLLGLAFATALGLLSIGAKWVSRKHEREADLEALELLGDPTSFVAVWPRIVLKDKANMEPTPWQKLTSTHPEISERMQFGVDWARMNDVEITLPPRRSVPIEATAGSA
jgi:STE24 endopeptidase